jgi:hypothetical protein
LALVFIEGFDHMTAAQATLKGWSNSPTSVSAGRFGGQCAHADTAGATAATKTLPSTYTTLFVGFAWQTATIGAKDILVLKSGATLTFRIGITAGGLLRILNSSGTTIATGTTVLAPSTWYYIEAEAVINGASGTATAHLNGAAEIAQTTGNFGSVALDGINYTSGGAGVVSQFDDIYACDTTTSVNNSFIGDSKVTTLFPTGDATYSQWTPSTGTAHWSLVDETTPDGDTSYVSDSTVGHIDSYTTGGVAASDSVSGIQTVHYARKDDAATRQIAPFIRQASTDYVGTTDTLASSYLFYTQLYNLDPAGSSWTSTNVNADEFGTKEIA